MKIDLKAISLKIKSLSYSRNNNFAIAINLWCKLSINGTFTRQKTRFVFFCKIKHLKDKAYTAFNNPNLL